MPGRCESNAITEQSEALSSRALHHMVEGFMLRPTDRFASAISPTPTMPSEVDIPRQIDVLIDNSISYTYRSIGAIFYILISPIKGGLAAQHNRHVLRSTTALLIGTSIFLNLNLQSISIGIGTFVSANLGYNGLSLWSLLAALILSYIYFDVSVIVIGFILSMGMSKRRRLRSKIILRYALATTLMTFGIVATIVGYIFPADGPTSFH